LNNLAPEGLTLLSGKGYGIDISASGEPTVGMLDHCDGIVVRSAKVDTDLFPRLIAVARAGAGYNNITVDKATAKGICVFNTPGANANAVAELVFTMIGYNARRISHAMDFVRMLKGTDAEINTMVEEGKSQFSGFELMGKTLGVIGLGKIGLLVANAGVRRGMRVIGYEAHPTAENMNLLDTRVQVAKNIEEVICAADILSVHVPLSGKTKNLIGAPQISLMKIGCVLVNYARSGIYNDDAVLTALATGKVSAYITDFPSTALIGNIRVDCTPHLGASTAEAETNCAVMAVNELSDYLNFGTIANSVNFPALEMPLAQHIRTRIAVVNRDVPNMIAAISGVFGNAIINIHDFRNASNGTLGYNLIDTAANVADELVEKIRQIPNVMRVRAIRFSK